MKEKQLFSIGEVAEMKGLTVKALRFYEEIGLLHPYKIDPFTKYRYYHRDQFLVIEIIKAARGMDVSPNDLVPYVKSKDTTGLLSLIQKHREEQTLKLIELHKLLDRLDGVTSELYHAQEVADNREVYLRTLPERHLLTRTVDSRKILSTSERIISELELLAEKRHLSGTYESGALLKSRVMMTLLLLPAFLPLYYIHLMTRATNAFPPDSMLVYLSTKKMQVLNQKNYRNTWKRTALMLA